MKRPPKPKLCDACKEEVTRYIFAIVEWKYADFVRKSAEKPRRRK